MELAAKMVKDEVSKNEDIPIEDIGVFITPVQLK